MHYDEVVTMDRKKILENPKVSSSRRYTEQELRRLLPRYSKSKYSVIPLMRRIDKAIQNEKLFCEDEEMIKDKIGSRVGLLMKEFRQ